MTCRLPFPGRLTWTRHDVDSIASRQRRLCSPTGPALIVRVRPLGRAGAAGATPRPAPRSSALVAGRGLDLAAVLRDGGAFGLPLQAAADLLPPGNAAAEFVGILVACAATLGCYALAVRLGEGRGASELALLPALPGLMVGVVLGLLMMAVLMGVMVVTGLYDITLVGAASAWTGLGLALQAAVTEELWMRALLLRLLWRASGPFRPSPSPRWSSAPCTWRTREAPRSPASTWPWPG